MRNKIEGAPGIGKSQILFLLTKPKWMPLWLHRWREKRAWLRWGRDEPLYIALPELDPTDIAMPFDVHNKHIAKPRPWPTAKENDNAPV